MIPFYRPPKLLDIEDLLVDWAKIYESGMLSNGEYSRKLEEDVARIHSVDHVVSCSSATSAMFLLLKALKTRKILMPSFTWKSIDAITSGFNRQWMDIDKDTWLPNVLGSSTKPFDTLMLHHTFGNIINVIEELDEWIVHDAAYSLGREFPVSKGAVISLSPTKTVTACEGGLVLVNDDRVARELTELRDSCSRLSELNAVVALAYLEKLEEIITRKKQIFDYYNKKLPFQHQQILSQSTYGYYGMLLPENVKNSRFRAGTSNQYILGIAECRVRYEPIVKGLKNTDYVAEHILCLPCYHSVNEEAVVHSVLSEEIA